MSKKRPSWEWQPSLVDPEIVFLRLPGWIFWPDKSEDEYVIVSVRLLGPRERDALEAFMLPLDFMGFSQRLISLSLVDENGNRLLSAEDETDLSNETSTLVFALTHAILEVNGMLPPPDQNVDHGKYVSHEAVIRSQYPSWPQEKIDACLEFSKHLQFATPVFSFQRSYAHKYRPGSKERDLILAAIRSVPEKEKADALDRLHKRHPKPIHGNFWKFVSRYVMRGLEEDARAHGIPVEKEKKNRLLGSLAVGAVTTRRKTGIFTTEEELTRKFKSSYRKEAESDFHAYRSFPVFQRCAIRIRETIQWSFTLLPVIQLVSSMNSFNISIFK